MIQRLYFPAPRRKGMYAATLIAESATNFSFYFLFRAVFLHFYPYDFTLLPRVFSSKIEGRELGSFGEERKRRRRWVPDISFLHDKFFSSYFYFILVIEYGLLQCFDYCFSHESRLV